MPRTARAAPSGYAYHVLNRGVGRMRLFRKAADFDAFQAILSETLVKVPLRVCAFCLMPNHWHFVVWPCEDGQVAAFFQRLTVTHVTRWQRHRDRVGEGHVYQGRYKSFPIEADDHFYQVVRYVERNPLRANLVSSVGEWRWSSFWLRENGTLSERAMLSAWPVPHPRNWRDRVNAVETERELEALRRSVSRGTPYGAAAWLEKTARDLGLTFTLRPRGRPRGT